MTLDENRFIRKAIFCRVDQLSTEGFVERRDYTASERFKRAGKISSLLFLGAFASLFVPILHFILVPVLLICCVVFGVLTWIERAEIRRGEFTCPQCKKLNTLSRQSESFPMNLRCSHCYFSLKVSDRPS